MTERPLALARWVALAYLASVPLQLWPLAKVGGTPVLLPDVLLAAAWLLTGVALVTSRGERIRDVAGLLAGGGAFLAALAISAVVAGRPPSSFVKLAAFAPMVLAPAMLRWLFPGPKEALRAIETFVAACAIALAIGLLTIVVFYVHRPFAESSLMCGYGALHRAGYPRLCAPFSNFNMFASYAIATVPLGVVLLERRVGRAAALGFAAIASVVVLFTLSAGIGAFALALAFAIGPLLGEGAVGRALRAVSWVGAALVELAFVAASLGTLVPRGLGTISLGARDYSWWDGSRPSILRAGFRTWAEHPFFGAGYGSAVAHVTDPRAYVPADKIPGGAFPPSADLEAHDLILSIAGQAGLAGLVAFVSYLAILCAPLVRKQPGERDDRLRGVLLVSIAAVVLVHGVFIAVEEARHFWPLMALAPLASLLSDARRADA